MSDYDVKAIDAVVNILMLKRQPSTRLEGWLL